MSDLCKILGYRLWLFADVHPSLCITYLLQLRDRELYRAVVIACSRIDGIKCLQALIQINCDAILDPERTYSARRVSDDRLNLLERDHLRFHVKRILIFAVVHPGRPFREDQHRLLSLQKGHRLRDPARLHTERLRSLRYRRRRRFQMDHMIQKAFSL